MNFSTFVMLLCVAILSNFQPLLANGLTFVVMGISIFGMLQSLLYNRKIQCACLNTTLDC